MTTITYTCDRCKKVQAKRADLYTLTLQAKNGEYGYSGHELTVSSSIPAADWCRDCCVETGFVKWQPVEKQPPAPPTLEEMIRQIAATSAQEMIQS